MRIPLLPTPAVSESLSLSLSGADPAPTGNGSPIFFIDSEPFIIELQGSLEMPGGAAALEGEMDGVTVGKMDVSDPNKPILQVAHHRLEGKLVKLAEPYALLRTTPASEGEENDGEGHGDGEDHVGSRTPKRLRLSSPPEEGGRGPTSSPEKMREEKMDQPPKIDIVGLVRRKIVFSKRPEPIITLSSDIDGMHEE